nr:hypothetical protein [uncultured Marinifilum sp.]
MKKSLIHRILLTLAFGVFVLASASAQDAVFLVGSTHKASLALHAGNTCEWKIYKVADFADQKDKTLAAAGDYTFKDGKNKIAAVEITWNTPGKYYLIVEEFNGGLGGCSTRRAFAIQVDDNLLQMEFAEIESSDCFDGNNETLLPIKLQANATNALAENNYDVTVNYTVLLEGVEVDSYTKTFTYADVGADGEVDLSVEGIVEELDKTKEYTIRINWAKDGFNTPFNIVSGKGTHTRTIYQLPQTGVMVQQ